MDDLVSCHFVRIDKSFTTNTTLVWFYIAVNFSCLTSYKLINFFHIMGKFILA